MTESPPLQQMVDAATDALIQSQNDDGRLGSFPKEKRLMVAWDLCGRFHTIVARRSHIAKVVKRHTRLQFYLDDELIRGFNVAER